MNVMEDRIDPAVQNAVFPVADSPYAPPQAVVADPAVVRVLPPHYVVAARKFFLLYLLTSGLYGIYWCYAHWARIRTVQRLHILPAGRALFPMFYTHRLARQLDGSLRESGSDYVWSPNLVATFLVVLQIASAVMERLSKWDAELGATDAMSIALLLPLAGLSWRLQHVANLACDDPAGASNRRLTWANWLWLVAGSVLLVLVVLGFLVPVE